MRSMNKEELKNRKKGKLTLQDNCNSPSPCGAIMTSVFPLRDLGDGALHTHIYTPYMSKGRYACTHQEEGARGTHSVLYSLS